ncbi:hypothetical protein CIB84_016787, partial [Bambusicola thoracicus]
VQVFLVEVLCNGRRHTVAKRYSEFQALHKRIKKSCKVPDFPPRRVPNWVPKVLEQRRQGLELYIQGVLCHNEELPQDVLDFLKVRRCQQELKGRSPVVSHPPSQQPVLGFHSDPYTQPPAMGKEWDVSGPTVPLCRVLSRVLPSVLLGFTKLHLRLSLQTHFPTLC